MSNELNQRNKEVVWDYWQKLNHVGVANVPAAIRAAIHDDVDWNGSRAHRPNHWRRQSHFRFLAAAAAILPRYKNQTLRLHGAASNRGLSDWAGEVGGEWVTGCGYLTGIFANDWLSIPATGKKTNIWFGQFYKMREGQNRRKLRPVRHPLGHAPSQLSGPASIARFRRRQDPRPRRQRRAFCSPSKTRWSHARAYNWSKPWARA